MDNKKMNQNAEILSEYEIQRLKNIERNKMILESLNIDIEKNQLKKNNKKKKYK
jgi:hypothetical protein